MYVIERPTKWDDFMHLTEFPYNNIYQTSIKMSLFEAMYGKKCHTPLSWSEPKDSLIFGIDPLQEME